MFELNIQKSWIDALNKRSSVRQYTGAPDKEQLDKLKKDGEAGEDEVDRAEKSLESLTKKQVEQVDKLLASKEAELLTL